MVQKADEGVTRSQGVCDNLLFIHVILGCDSTSCLFGIGKGMALKKVNNTLMTSGLVSDGVGSKSEGLCHHSTSI